MKHLKIVESISAIQAALNEGTLHKPYVVLNNNENETRINYGKVIEIDYSKQYLTFEPIADSTFTFSRNALQYSVDNGSTWTTLAANTASPIVTTGNKIIFKQISHILNPLKQ